MQLAMHSDTRKTPKLHEYRPMTHEEAKQLSAGDHPAIRLPHSGRVGYIKVDGAVKRWKREPERFEVPAKYGRGQRPPQGLYVLYEYTVFVPQADGTVSAWGMPEVILLVAV